MFQQFKRYLNKYKFKLFLYFMQLQKYTVIKYITNIYYNKVYGIQSNRQSGVSLRQEK